MSQAATIGLDIAETAFMRTAPTSVKRHENDPVDAQAICIARHARKVDLPGT